MRIQTISDYLNDIRKPDNAAGNPAAAAAVIFGFGIVLGLFSKWLDDLALEDAIWWHRLVGRMDLGNFFSDIAVWLLLALVIAVFSTSALCAALNVFVFFAGMCAAYHLYTIVFSGFNPLSYMMIWYGITLLSPILAVLCWYAKGSGIPALILDSGILSVFFLSCFSIGLFYADLKGALYLLVFCSAAAVLYRSPKQLLIILAAGLLLAFVFSPFWPFR